MNIPDPIAESLETILGVKILKFFDANPGSGKEEIRIRDKLQGSLLKIISEPEIDTEVELDGGVHDILGGPLHAVVQAGVDDVLLRRAGHPLVKLNTTRALVPPHLTK
jgi:hypothetical protein